MDTGTHIVMGLALGGIATLDPIVTADPQTTHAVIIGTLIGSQAPDLDTILKLRNNAQYIRNHRGITHSLPAVLLWPLLITAVISFFFPAANVLHLWIWTFIGVILHVFVDIFNAYGTQALRPFSNKWVALGVINTFDPFIFLIHLVGIIIWQLGAHPGYTFFTIYGVLFLYYIIRYYLRRQVKLKVRSIIDNVTDIIISPTYRFNQWHIAVVTDQFFYVARAKNNEIMIQDKFYKRPIPDTPVIKAAVKDKNLAAFLSFSPVYRWEVDEYDDHYDVRFIDLRYRSKGHYPFVAVVKLNLKLEIMNSYTGWIFSEEKLQKKLEFIPS
ncbi:metal-dependent hydrolase [Ferdinandcohnia quinoae]|uniref:Metal-dependent hydrolase n=1 Tax=Fredinandcohnia quinoae TaxID=2918902 RepID=A0AAW5E3M2_9BACI|nr:metal-dependent hydrolase [Fredinandcohnia sp. SECRCQ15]MCH1627525.1 metal-dependent hydrolase [Fredinandcohnia sp. SECRCQ15]